MGITTTGICREYLRFTSYNTSVSRLVIGWKKAPDPKVFRRERFPYIGLKERKPPGDFISTGVLGDSPAKKLGVGHRSLVSRKRDPFWEERRKCVAYGAKKTIWPVQNCVKRRSSLVEGKG